MVKKYLNAFRFMTLITVVCLMGILAGCQFVDTSPTVVEKLETTVVEDEDVPKELMEMIDDKKKEAMHLTYSTNEYMYIVVGYGTQKTSGYSIRLEDIYLGENAIYVKTTLIGPKKGENTNAVNTYPYIVLKLERREEPVIFQ